MLPPMCVDVSVPRNEWDCMPDIASPGSHLTPNTNTRGHRLACVVLEGHGMHGGSRGCPIGWQTRGASRLAAAVADVSARDASASPPALGAFSPNGDVRVNSVAGNNSEDMSLLAAGHASTQAPPMREAPIVRREHAIAARYYADLDIFVPGLSASHSECIFVAACCTLYLLSRSPVMVVGSRVILYQLLGWTAGYPRASRSWNNHK